MIRLFLSISKGEELRFLGHLDYLRTMERAIMRSGLPVAFSEGFNPHMKISMDSALGVGLLRILFIWKWILKEKFLLMKLSQA